MRSQRILLLSTMAAATLAVAAVRDAPIQPTVARNLQLVVVVDGLRPDYVTPALMPRLTRLAQRGTSFNAHHSVFPTVTRVNAASMVTGVYPEGHGLIGNTMYVPAANATRGLDTGQKQSLESIARADGRLLSAPSLGEMLQRAGRTLLAVGSGSSGAVFLLNHTASGGPVLHHEFTLPPTLSAHVLEKLGPAPPHAQPNAAQNRRAVDAYLTIGLDELHPDVTLMWISDPDTTAHTHGIGSTITQSALSLVDAEIGRIEDTLRARALLDRTNIIVISDHGFSTHTRTFNLSSIVAPFAKPMPDGSPDIVVAEGAVYLRSGRDPARVAAIVGALQRNADVGAIFTRPRNGGGAEGEVPGTLSYDLVRWNHARSGDILVSANWTADANDAGFPGKTPENGTAGHGSSSPYDTHATLMAAGPDFREHATSDIPTGNADLAPTLLRLSGLDVPQTMTARVIDEGFRNGPRRSADEIRRSVETVKSPDGRYQLTAHFSTAAGRRYLDFTEVKRLERQGR